MSTKHTKSHFKSGYLYDVEKLIWKRKKTTKRYKFVDTMV